MLVPCGHRVLVKVKEVEEVTAGGIVLPNQVREKEENAGVEGVLMAVGPNAWKAFDGGESWARVGDTVLFGRYNGVVHQEGGSKYRLLNDDDIIAVVSYGS